MKRKLPLLVERTLADERANAVEMSSTFEQKVHDAVTNTKLALMCKPGCSNCCYHPFHVSIFQGLVIQQWLAEHARWTPTLRKKLEEASGRTLALDTDVWMKSVIPCPLLNDKQRCTVYDIRPLHCRVTFATTPPDLCHPHELDKAHHLPRYDVLNRFHEREQVFFKRHGLRGFYMPLSTALLIAEKIHAGEVDLDDADMELGRKMQAVR